MNVFLWGWCPGVALLAIGQHMFNFSRHCQVVFPDINGHPTSCPISSPALGVIFRFSHSGEYVELSPDLTLHFPRDNEVGRLLVCSLLLGSPLWGGAGFKPLAHFSIRSFILFSLRF